MSQKTHFSNKRHRIAVTGALFASPWIIGFTLFGLYPIIMSVYYSMSKFNVFQPPVWIGLSNYKELFKDELFYKSLYNTLYMTSNRYPFEPSVWAYYGNVAQYESKRAFNI